jgi:hypothetical protein
MREIITMGKELDRISKEEIEAEDAVPLPNKEVMSLLDVNANVDLGLDLAAPVDLAVAANLNVAAPIEAAASANLLSPDAQAISLAQQQGSIDQGITGSADAIAPQHASVDQNANPVEGGTTAGGETATPMAAQALEGTTGDPVGTVGDTVGGVGDTAGGTVGDAAGGTVGDVGGAAGGAVGDVGDAAGGAVGDVGSGAGDAVGDVGSGVGNLLSDGSLLDANVNIHANANLAAPIDGAVAANGNVAAPIDAAVAANIGSDHAVAEALAPQEVNIHQSLDDVEANATATQDADVNQK